LKLVLPYSPGKNHLYATVRGRRVKSREARDYADTVKQIAAISRCVPLSGPISIKIDVYRPRRTGDLDGRLIAVLDSLQGQAYHNDNQIVEIRARRFDDKADPRIEVVIEEMKQQEEAQIGESSTGL
jgi:crossover junction endodeoxyribonuclease RusA